MTDMYHKDQADNSHCFVQCKVMKSLPSAPEKKDPDHVVWICMAEVWARCSRQTANAQLGMFIFIFN